VVVGGMVTAPFAILLLIPVLASIWPKAESERLPATSN
jgi:dipeptide/tripeptide permease